MQIEGSSALVVGGAGGQGAADDKIQRDAEVRALQDVAGWGGRVMFLGGG